MSGNYILAIFLDQNIYGKYILAATGLLRSSRIILVLVKRKSWFYESPSELPNERFTEEIISFLTSHFSVVYFATRLSFWRTSVCCDVWWRQLNGFFHCCFCSHLPIILVPPNHVGLRGNRDRDNEKCIVYIMNWRLRVEKGEGIWDLSWIFLHVKIYVFSLNGTESSFISGLSVCPAHPMWTGLKKTKWNLWIHWINWSETAWGGGGRDFLLVCPAWWN